MIIQAILQKLVVRENFPLSGHAEKNGEPFSKDFESIREMQDWISKQNEHPRVCYILLSYVEHIEHPNGNVIGQEFTWDNWKATE